MADSFQKRHKASFCRVNNELRHYQNSNNRAIHQSFSSPRKIQVLTLSNVMSMFIVTTILMVMPVMDLPGIAVSRQTHLWPVPWFRVKPDIALIRVIVTILIVVLILIKLYRSRKCGYYNQISPPAKPYYTSWNKQCWNQSKKQWSLHIPSR